VKNKKREPIPIPIVETGVYSQALKQNQNANV